MTHFNISRVNALGRKVATESTTSNGAPKVAKKGLFAANKKLDLRVLQRRDNAYLGNISRHANRMDAFFNPGVSQ